MKIEKRAVITDRESKLRKRRMKMNEVVVVVVGGG